MRAREFVINVPITIHIDGNGDPVVSNQVPPRKDYATEKTVPDVSNLPPKDPSELDPDPVMVPPLQQQIEINKAALGKESPVIDELTQDEIDPEDEKST